MDRKNKQQQLAELLEQKGSVDLLDLQRGTHGIRTSNPASIIFELRKKGYDITTYENHTKEGKYISTVYKLNSLPLPEKISGYDRNKVEKIDVEIAKLRLKSQELKKTRREILHKYY